MKVLRTDLRNSYNPPFTSLGGGIIKSDESGMILFVCVDTLHPIQKIFSPVISRGYSVLLKDIPQCSR